MSGGEASVGFTGGAVVWLRALGNLGPGPISLMCDSFLSPWVGALKVGRVS